MRAALLAIIALIPFGAYSEGPDSLRVKVPVADPSAVPAPEEMELSDSLGYNIPGRRSPGALMLEPGAVPAWQSRFAVPDMRFIPGMAPVSMWNSGGIYAAGGRSAFNGLMGIESGSLNLVQSFGRLSFMAHVDATKIGFYRGLSTQWGFGGSMTYTFSPTASLTVFGNYYTRPGGIANPGIREMVPTASFGGYVDWRFAGRWGVRAGAVARQTTFSNRYELQPMVMPYFSIAPGAEIGVDVGGILYNMFKSNSGSGPHNPTIGPIKPGPPPVGPRN